MEKTILLVLLCFILIVSMAQGVVLGESKAVEKWFYKLPHAKQMVTKFRFYFHDIVSGKNPTAVQIAQSNMTAKSPTAFGFVTMIDDPLTVGPEPNSTIVGRAQGIYGSADQNEVALLMTLNFVFTTGKYNGSTLSVLGRNPVFHQHREMPIVGGSGVFRLAQGIAAAKTYSLNTTNGDAIVEYNVIVLHYHDILLEVLYMLIMKLWGIISFCILLQQNFLKMVIRFWTPLT
ncbi:dirigent protein 22-like [Solanum stenotomum]|uniref:dirigent protein 22-like n=1 Tax=Solanum stenotomum TaxID=172797 RepID=UPI0020D09571|nr:dirigent protein 22-like [Solanum stenotomum]XP_049400780.1 dirigent protein 22-like [Solanum stenotomum]